MTAMASLLVKLSCILFPFNLENIKPVYSLEDFGSIQQVVTCPWNFDELDIVEEGGQIHHF
tara:strand:- start:54 stop:236 length:183 start_codon:yes stop_codon:yes gene_type:complete